MASIEADSPVSWEKSLEPNYLADPYALTEEVIRTCPPVFQVIQGDPQMGGGMWVATRSEAIREIFQNNDHYSTADIYPYFRQMGEDLRAIPLQIDLPEHTKYRKFLEPWFSPKAIMKLEPQIRATVNGLIDGFADQGECDVSYDFSRIYPVRVFMDLMGFPAEVFEDFLAWSHCMHFETHDPERVIWGARNALDYMRRFIAELKKVPPDGQLASAIVHGQIEGRPITDDEMVGMIFFLWNGGMDTVASTSSLIFRQIALDPVLQQELRVCGPRMANAIEEFLRMNPTVNTVRSAKIDHVLEGQHIKAGDRLLCLVATGNFDPDKYDDPRSFRMDRVQNRHFTFVAGAHRCLGINLARFEMQIAFREFLARIPSFVLKPGVKCEATPGLRGAPNVPIVWNSAEAA